MRLFTRQLIVIPILLVACDKSGPEPTTPPDEAASVTAQDESKTDTESNEGPDGEAAASTEGPAEEPKDSFMVATFNLAWAHDTIGDGPKLAEQQRAQEDEDWEWKLAAIAKVLSDTKPEVVALHELGGHLELTELVTAVEKAGGPKYEWAYQDSDDPHNGHNSAILSQYPISGDRRLDIHLRRHVATEIELPTGDMITVIAIHAPEGTRANAVKARRNQAEALVREIQDIREQRPVIVLGTLGSNIVPADEDYADSAAGMFAGENTNTDEDDCDDSSEVGLVLETTTDGKLADRIFTCDLEMRDAETRGGEAILREDLDEWSKPWSAVPVDKAPHRDVSDHLLLVAEVELPKKAKEGEGEGEDEGEGE